MNARPASHLHTGKNRCADLAHPVAVGDELPALPSPLRYPCCTTDITP
jgi:hypothetical protein